MIGLEFRSCLWVIDILIVGISWTSAAYGATIDAVTMDIFQVIDSLSCFAKDAATNVAGVLEGDLLLVFFGIDHLAWIDC